MKINCSMIAFTEQATKLLDSTGTTIYEIKDELRSFVVKMANKCLADDHNYKGGAMLYEFKNEILGMIYSRDRDLLTVDSVDGFLDTCKKCGVDIKLEVKN